VRGKTISRELQRISIDLPRVTLGDLAKAVGQSVSSLHKYRRGDEEMPAVVKHRLAEFLRQQASMLIRLASDLDKSS
jgi:hypothetical protein